MSAAAICAVVREMFYGLFQRTNCYLGVHRKFSNFELYLKLLWAFEGLGESSPITNKFKEVKHTASHFLPRRTCALWSSQNMAFNVAHDKGNGKFRNIALKDVFKKAAPTLAFSHVRERAESILKANQFCFTDVGVFRKVAQINAHESVEVNQTALECDRANVFPSLLHIEIKVTDK